MKKNKFTYKEYNANFKNKKTTDCVVRAISVALNKSWEDTFKELSAYTLKTGYMWNDNGACGFKKFLKIKGYEKQKMPRRKDNTRYTVKDFIEEFNTLIDNIKSCNGLNKTIIPISTTGIPIDGAHRIAISLYLNLEIKLSIKQ